MKRIACIIALSIGTMMGVVLPLPTAQAQQAQKVEYRILLTGPVIGGTRPEGKATYKAEPAKRSFRVEAQARVANGTVGVVMVNGVTVGKITFAAGVGSLSLNTERGQAVPTITPGTLVTVWGASNIPMLAGSF